MNKTYLIPEQIDALWSVVDSVLVVDSVFVGGARNDLAYFLQKHPDYAVYGGDRCIEDAEDQTLMKVLDQLHEGLTDGNVELNAHLRRALDEVLTDLCRGTVES
jgi:hypothetical protein